jgi:hypothetical protein
MSVRPYPFCENSSMQLTSCKGSWSSTLRDIYKAPTNIYDASVGAGPEACPLYEDSTDKLRSRVNVLIDNDHLSPIPVYTGDQSQSQPPASFSAVDYTSFKLQFLQILYTPYVAASPFLSAYSSRPDLHTRSLPAPPPAPQDTAASNSRCIPKARRKTPRPSSRKLNSSRPFSKQRAPSEEVREEYGSMLGYSTDWAGRGIMSLVHLARTCLFFFALGRLEFWV